MTEEQQTQLSALKSLLSTYVDPVLQADWTLPIPPGMQENPSFLGQLLQKVDSFSDTLTSVLTTIATQQSPFKEVLSESKAVFADARRRKMLELVQQPSQPRLSKELLEFKAEEQLQEEMGQLAFAEACMEAFHDAKEILELKRKQLSHKRNDLLGMVGALRSSSIMHRGPGDRYAADLREAGEHTF